MTEQRNRDEYYMKQAVLQAQKAFLAGEVPIGAVVVDPNGKIIGRGYNLTESNYCQSKHAEIQAIQAAGKVLKDWRLTGCTLYVTIGPCLMCFGLIGLSRIERLVYGLKSPLFGYDLDNESLPDLYKKHIRGISTGILASEIETILKNFFKTKREKSGQSRSDQKKAD
jgi:tRNA(adenine34) deaminase